MKCPECKEKEVDAQGCCEDCGQVGCVECGGELDAKDVDADRCAQHLAEYLNAQAEDRRDAAQDR